MARKGYPSDKQDQYMLRLPDGMRERIKAAAEANGRSMNAEIVARIENSEHSLASILPPALMNRLMIEASLNRRSVEAEVLSALEKAYPLPTDEELAGASASMTAWMRGMREILREFPQKIPDSERFESELAHYLELFEKASPDVAGMLAHRIWQDLKDRRPPASKP